MRMVGEPPPPFGLKCLFGKKSGQDERLYHWRESSHDEQFLKSGESGATRFVLGLETGGAGWGRPLASPLDLSRRKSQNGLASETTQGTLLRKLENVICFVTEAYRASCLFPSMDVFLTHLYSVFIVSFVPPLSFTSCRS